jgi:hypothetical protein
LNRLTCYQIHDYAPRIVAASADRAWMDMTDRRYAYRCIPLSIANAMGWDVLSPTRVTAEWNGGTGLPDITVTVEDPAWEGKLASSHFGHGILTFHTGYLFRTEPGVGLWVRGTPNWPKDGIAPLDGIVETDWLTFTFTMNWHFTRPGRIVFEKDEPFCFISPIAYRALENLQPEIVPLSADPELQKQYETWRVARLDFNARLARNEPEAARQGWQKFYIRGADPSGVQPSPHHLSKIKLAEPVARPLSEAARENEPSPR